MRKHLSNNRLSMTALAILCLFSSTSCSKKKEDDPVKDALVGKWRLVESGYDQNKNDILDSVEAMMTPDALCRS